jgi:hypothetical protein
MLSVAISSAGQLQYEGKTQLLTDLPQKQQAYAKLEHIHRFVIKPPPPPSPPPLSVFSCWSPSAQPTGRCAYQSLDDCQ